VKRGQEGGAQWGLGQVSKCFPPYPLLHRAELGGKDPEKVKLGATANKTTHYLGQQSDMTHGGFWWAGRKTHHTDVPKGIRTPDLQVRFPTRPPGTVRLNTVNRKGENRMPSDALDTPKFLGWGDTTQVVNAARATLEFSTVPPLGRGWSKVQKFGVRCTPALLIYSRKESSQISHMRKAAASVLTDRSESGSTPSRREGCGDPTTTAFRIERSLRPIFPFLFTGKARSGGFGIAQETREACSARPSYGP